MNKSWHTYWRELASGSRTGLADNLLLMFLTPLARLYSLALRLRSRLYQQGIFKTHHLPRPVVSIGNITVGGTGISGMIGLLNMGIYLQTVVFSISSNVLLRGMVNLSI